MAHDVFISYETSDRKTADALCAVLERRRLRCWIAPRDITPGATWAEAIVNAIEDSGCLVIVLTERSNRSPQTMREVNTAVDAGVPVVPLRTEPIEPSGAMRHYLSTTHWMDALTPPREHAMEELADKLRPLIGQRTNASPTAPEPTTPAPRSKPARSRPRTQRPSETAKATASSTWWIASSVVAALVIGGGVWIANADSQPTPSNATSEESRKITAWLDAGRIEPALEALRNADPTVCNAFEARILDELLPSKASARTTSSESIQTALDLYPKAIEERFAALLEQDLSADRLTPALELLRLHSAAPTHDRRREQRIATAIDNGLRPREALQANDTVTLIDIHRLLAELSPEAARQFVTRLASAARNLVTTASSHPRAVALVGTIVRLGGDVSGFSQHLSNRFRLDTDQDLDAACAAIATLRGLEAGPAVAGLADRVRSTTQGVLNAGAWPRVTAHLDRLTKHDLDRSEFIDSVRKAVGDANATNPELRAFFDARRDQLGLPTPLPILKTLLARAVADRDFVATVASAHKARERGQDDTEVRDVLWEAVRTATPLRPEQIASAEVELEKFDADLAARWRELHAGAAKPDPESATSKPAPVAESGEQTAGNTPWVTADLTRALDRGDQSRAAELIKSILAEHPDDPMVLLLVVRVTGSTGPAHNAKLARESAVTLRNRIGTKADSLDANTTSALRGALAPLHTIDTDHQLRELLLQWIRELRGGATLLEYPDRQTLESQIQKQRQKARPTGTRAGFGLSRT